MDATTVGAVAGALSLVLAAAVTGWFGLRAQRQATKAESTTTEVRVLGGEVQQALTLVGELVASGREKDRTNADLQARLDACLAER